MMAQILEDMWVDPVILEALNEEQKRILFLRMREEQVRRWRVREEKENMDGENNSKARSRKAPSKRVSWLLGHDGDVSVSIIGEVDELRSCKVLQNLMNKRVHTDSVSGIQTADLPPGGGAPRHSSEVPFTHVSEGEADSDSSGADSDLKDPAEDRDGEPGESSDDNIGSNGDAGRRPRLGNHGNRPLGAQLSDSTQDREAPCCRDKSVVCLRKAFTDEPHSGSPAVNKPLVPVKPAHLQGKSSPLIH